MDWKEIAIPDQSELRAKTGARQYPLDLGSEENKESAVNILEHGIRGKNYYHREDNPPYMHRAPGSIPELYVREGVFVRLVTVNELLAPLGLLLFVHDAYRPVEVQNYFHDTWVPNYLRGLHPSWSDEEIANEVGKYWAKGFPSKGMIDPSSPPPHATGGVVDLTLIDQETGAALFMGGDFDEVSSISFADHFEREGERRILSQNEKEAQANRRVLYHAMTSAGFVVNPNEWWHFGFGDQLSARNSGAPCAVYSVLWLPGEKTE